MHEERCSIDISNFMLTMLRSFLALLSIRLAAAIPVIGSGDKAWQYPSLEDWQDQPEMAQQGNALWSSMQRLDERISSQAPQCASEYPSEPIRSVLQEQHNRSDNAEAYYNSVLAEAARDPTYSGPQGLGAHKYWDLFERSRRDPDTELPFGPLRRQSDRAHRESAARSRIQRQRAPDYQRYYNEDGTKYNEEIQQFIRNLMDFRIPIDVIYNYVWEGIEDGQIDNLKRYQIVCETRWESTPMPRQEEDDDD